MPSCFLKPKNERLPQTGWAKYVAERQLAVLPGVKVGVARVFHTYGPNIYLEDDRGQIIGSLIRKAVRYPREGFVMWGNGTQRRAFLFIDVFLDGLFRLDEYVETKGNLAVNLCSTKETTIKDLAEKIRATEAITMNESWAFALQS
jgi:nucleoside-diphosphate-sugar epimerase